ncbi:MAG: AMP-binding protein [Weeksellaceae bacterium]|nr:AMP-binding protein [Weeksellaceae bacterium]
MVVDFNDLNMSQLAPQTAFEEKVVTFTSEWFSDSTTVHVQTSGSTGVPKILEVEKSRMRSSAQMTCDFLGLREGDSALLCLPVEYISGKMMVVRALVRKLKLHVESPSTRPLDNLTAAIDFCAMSPLQVEHSLHRIHLIKKLIIGGAQVSESLKRKIQGNTSLATDCRIYETYGMSETLSHIALKEIFPKAEEYFSVFEGIEISQDSKGCLQISAPALHSVLLQTNDLVELKSSRQFKFIGRLDHVINSGGLKIHPEHLENILKRHLDNEVVFAGVDDEMLGQKLILLIEGEETESLMSRLTVALLEIQSFFSKNQVPKETLFINPFPRTPNGKINRLELLNLLDRPKL